MDVARVSDVAPVVTPEGAMRPLLFGEHLSAIHLEVPSGLAVPPHSHPREGLAYCLGGSVELALEGGRSVVLTADTAVVLRAGQAVGLRNPGPEPAKLLLVSSPPAATSAEELRARIETAIAKHGHNPD